MSSCGANREGKRQAIKAFKRLCQIIAALNEAADKRCVFSPLDQLRHEDSTDDPGWFGSAAEVFDLSMNECKPAGPLVPPPRQRKSPAQISQFQKQMRADPDLAPLWKREKHGQSKGSK